MLTRRELLRGAGAALLVSRGAGLSAMAAGTPQSALVFDAMGEIRDVYEPELVREILSSGLDAITVTLCDPKTYELEAVNAAMRGIAAYDRYLEGFADLFVKATRVADIDRARREGKLAVFYLFQNSTQFGRDLASVDRYYELGVRSSQITYNHQNWAGSGCKERAGSGLTEFGHQLVERMNEVRMLIDLSHAGMRTMTDAIGASRAPVVISHTACTSVYEHERNTTDNNLRLLAERGGVVGICQIRPFITSYREGAFEAYLDHLLHAIDVAGIEHVAIGSDRDHRVIEMTEEYLAELKAEEGPNFVEADWPLYMDELNGPRRMEVVWAGLERRGVKGARLEKVMGGNLYRLYEEVVG
jgi:membrane dipeptidase